MADTTHNCEPVLVQEIRIPAGTTIKLFQPDMTTAEWESRGRPYIVIIENEGK